MAIRRLEALGETQDRQESGGMVSYAARLIVQGKHRFFTLSMPSDVLAETCVVDTRDKNPIDGFQRVLDPKRAQEIADYIDNGFGTIPNAIVLSAQPDAELEYVSRTQVLKFKKTKRAFLILDGQHRVYGFHKARARLRVPVVIYNNLSKADEARLFIDINTKQRPVPNELLLDIKRMAQTENDVEALLRDVFDLFDKDPNSPLTGLMSPSTRSKGKISRVTFNTALKAIWNTIQGTPSTEAYSALSAYIHAWLPGLRQVQAAGNLTNSTLFRAIVLLFPLVAERVSDRHGAVFTADNFREVLDPLFMRVKKHDLRTPGASPVELYEKLVNALQSGFSIGRKKV
jgi:DGQHR domain-containing protein